jgi:hypothetical protein
VFVAAIRSQVRVRCAWDFDVQSRPQGKLFTVGVVLKIRSKA